MKGWGSHLTIEAMGLSRESSESSGRSPNDSTTLETVKSDSSST